MTRHWRSTAAVYVVGICASLAAGDDSVNLTVLVDNPGEWPAEVMLTQKLTWPVVAHGQPMGTMELPAGMKLKLVEVQGERIKVSLGEVTEVIPASVTDLTARVLAIRRARVPHTVAVKSPAKETAMASHAAPSSLPAGVTFSIEDERGSDGPFAVFEVLKFQLHFDQPDQYQKLLQDFGEFSISGRSTVNGSPLSKQLVDRLRVQAHGKPGQFTILEWYPVHELLPPKAGDYEIQIVLNTPKGRWTTPATTVRVEVPEVDREPLEFLLSNGGAGFFSREVVLRTKSEKRLPEPPFAAIKQCVQKFPQSGFVTSIVRQADHARALDVSFGPGHYLDEDREQLADIIALAHPAEVEELVRQKLALQNQIASSADSFRKQSLQRDIEGLDRWIALLKKRTL